MTETLFYFIAHAGAQAVFYVVDPSMHIVDHASGDAVSSLCVLLADTDVAAHQ